MLSVVLIADKEWFPSQREEWTAQSWAEAWRRYFSAANIHEIRIFLVLNLTFVHTYHLTMTTDGGWNQWRPHDSMHCWWFSPNTKEWKQCRVNYTFVLLCGEDSACALSFALTTHGTMTLQKMRILASTQVNYSATSTCSSVFQLWVFKKK